MAPTLIEWEEQERARRSPERRLKDTMAIYDKALLSRPPCGGDALKRNFMLTDCAARRAASTQFVV
jgi:hypothetical protein